MGECYFCLSKASHSCRLCGRPVCDTHGGGGVCVACREAICAVCGRELAVSYCSGCGRLGCVDCLVQYDPVRRFCRDCLARGASEFKPEALEPLKKVVRRVFGS
ncbi:hypothetical protein APE_0242.1 [Aeropyrum pernix K1]|uniref:B box-type domain-containing protein n=1 Tax=Aeropyrum pernix (strain ATCC 700893 / DSM 11879 / JCM 9820 / NBRC 100138 / K1) TaxID=272557 RepID=Q9YFK6_AERPE|nr:hypothetical protein APE_0242.1 [Aeropyrum pernix K1]